MNVDEFEVVPLTASHIPGYRAVLDKVAKERRYLNFFEAPPLASMEEFVDLLQSVGFPHFVALVNRQVVGWCDISPLNRPVFRHVGVLGIGVAAEFRARGIGAALLDAALARAREIGLRRIELTVRAHNHVAIALYQKRGFTVEGTKRNAVEVDGAYEDLLMMALLSPGARRVD